MHVATIEVIGHHRLALKLLAHMINTGTARQFEGHGVEAIASSAIAGGVIAWEKATPMELAQLITTIRQAIDLQEHCVNDLAEDPDEVPTAADPAEVGAEPEAVVYAPGQE